MKRMKRMMDDERLITALKETGLDEPSAEFSNRLCDIVIQQRAKKPVTGYAVENWLGKFIQAVLVSFNILFLFFLNPLSAQPQLFISIAALVMGLWAVIAIIQLTERRNVM